ncbi:MAG: endonuclease [Williamsia sp.]|nr:endonuclease [Williamsia sp.]
MEGPALTLLKEEAHAFIGKKIVEASGSSKVDWDTLAGQQLRQLQSWGKHFLLVLDNCTIRIHYLMFGNYYLNSRHPDKTPKLSLQFNDGSEWNNYNCAVRILPETDMSRLYDFSTDIMDESWNAAKAKAKLKNHPGMQVCDALMNQDIFAGVGNVIKNEALFRIAVQPESLVGALPPRKLTELLREAHTYSYDFYRWRKEGVLRKKYCVHQRKYCPTCDTLLVKKPTGELQRNSFYCPVDQVLYT